MRCSSGPAATAGPLEAAVEPLPEAGMADRPEADGVHQAVGVAAVGDQLAQALGA